MSSISLRFTCPKCRKHRIEEVMVDAVVTSDIYLLHPTDGSDDFEYGQSTNDDGHVDRYQCRGCGWLILNDTYEKHTQNGLDGEALILRIRELNAPGKNNPGMRPLEMAVALGSGEWYAGVFIEIPDDTPEEQVNSAGIHVMMQQGGINDVASIWVYNSMEDSRPE